MAQVATWQEKVKLGKESQAAFGTEVATTHILPVTNNVQLKQNREKIDFGVRPRGVPYKTDDDFAVGRQKPDFTLDTPMTQEALKWILTTLFQGFTESGTDPWTETFNPYSAAVATYGMTVEKERGATVGEGDKALGAIANSLAVTMAVDGGIGLSAGCINISTADLDAIPGGESEIADTILTMADFALEIDTVVVNIISADFTIINNALHVPKAGDAPEEISLGMMDWTGRFRVYWKGNSALRTAMRAKTIKTLEFLSGTPAAADEVNFKLDVKLDEVNIEEEGNIYVADCTFQQAKNANTLSVVVGTSAQWTWTA